MIDLFRIHGAAYDVFDTIGTALFDGRWHKCGARVVYAAQHVSLAALEVLIHAEGRKLPPKVLTHIQLPEKTTMEEAVSLSFAESQRFGSTWIAEKRSVVLRVPSIAVNGLEFNYLLNPAHPGFSQIIHKTAVSFPFDERFFTRR